MITLHSVSKETGRQHFRRLVLDNVDWLIRPRTQIVVLGHRMSGAEYLPGIIAGTVMPTSGWVERRGVVSMPGGLLRYAQDNLQQLINRLSQLYKVDPKEVKEFIAQALDRHDLFEMRPRALPQQLQKQLGTLLTYAFPCDLYLFSNAPVPHGEGRFQTYCRKAYELRGKQASFVVTTNSIKNAQRLDEEMMGALVYQGNFTLYKTLADAIAVFSSLPPPEESLDQIEDLQEDSQAEEDLDLM